jgi:hypothetical protein
MKLDFSKYGIKEAIIKFGKILGWYAASGLLAGAYAIIANYHPTESQYMAVLIIASINSALAGLSKWLTTHKPQE